MKCQQLVTMSLSKQEQDMLVSELMGGYGSPLQTDLDAKTLQMIHSDVRVGGISLPQVEESINYVCLSSKWCEPSEMLEVMQEMDRRYFLVQHLKWEFSLLDTNSSDTISEEQAKWFVQMVHGDLFSKRKWDTFLRQRAVPGSGVTFAEIEVMLCNIPSLADLMGEEEEERREALLRAQKQREMEMKLDEERKKRQRIRDAERHRLEEEENRRRKEEERRMQEEQEERLRRQREKEEAEERRRRLEEEESRGKLESDERDMKRRRQDEERDNYKKEAEALRELEEKKRKEEELRRQQELQEAADYERLYLEAKKEENEAEAEADRHKKRAAEAEDDKLKKEAEDSEKRARLRWREARNRRIRYNLKVSIKKRDEQRLPVAVDDFKKAKLPDDDMDLEKAEKILREWQARDGLNGAMSKRKLLELEKAIQFVKRNGFEFMLATELIEANKILLQLRRLERIRAEILELKQSTVAEIRSYQKPPKVVHQVMTGTFVILGHKTSEMKDWKQIQMWVGKTGKEGLKRRCLELDPGDIPVPVANHAKGLLSDFDLDDVRDVSAGAATFYAWSWTMIEELEAREAAKEREKEKRKERHKAKKREEALIKANMAKAKENEAKAEGEAETKGEGGAEGGAEGGEEEQRPVPDGQE